jgi:hypothetical protein
MGSNGNGKGEGDKVKGFTSKKDGYAFFGAILLNMLLGTLYCWSCYLVTPTELRTLHPAHCALFPVP